jgi:hypothetical protein
MSAASLEARVEALETEVRHLKDLIDKGQRKRGWKIIIGAFANDPLYDEAMRLGREYRESQRPGKRKKPQKAKGKHDRS